MINTAPPLLKGLVNTIFEAHLLFSWQSYTLGPGEDEVFCPRTEITRTNYAG